MTKGKLRKTSKGDLVFEKFIAIVRGAIRERNEQIVKEAMKISESVIQKMLDSNSDIIIDSSFPGRFLKISSVTKGMKGCKSLSMRLST